MMTSFKVRLAFTQGIGAAAEVGMSTAPRLRETESPFLAGLFPHVLGMRPSGAGE
jgi:hypothetical protein